MERLSWHFDFHSHRDIRINHAPDVAGMARTLAAAGVEEIITFAKCHTGFAYYPSTVGYPHPRMVGDPLGDVVRACTGAGLRVLAYISFGIDGEAARRHPEWAQVSAQGPHLTPDWFISVCPYTPYLDESVLPMIAEVLAAYPVDGFFFDTMGAMGICYCDCCEREFRALHGTPLPRDPKDPAWGAYGQFRHDRAARVVARVGRFIADRKPDAKVGFNWIGTARFPEPLPPGISCLTCDFSTTGPQSLQAAFHAAYGANVDRPCDVMNTVFNHGWGDWAPRPLPGLEQEAVTVWAHRCRPYVGDRLHPANRLDPVSVRAIRHLGGMQRRLAREYPDADASLTRELLVLTGPGLMYGTDGRRFATDYSGLAPVSGAHRLALDAGADVGIVPECFLANHLPACRLLVVPEMPCLAPETEARLRDYVTAGGRLLVVGGPPTVGGRSLADLLGVTREAQPWQDHIYLPPWSSADGPLPVLVRGPFHRLQLAGADAVLPAIQPYDCHHGMRFGHGIGPAGDGPSEFAALACHRVGKGEAWYLEAPIFSDYEARSNPAQFAWFRELLVRLLPHPTARVLSAAGSVEVVAQVNRQTTWAFLINHGGEQLNPNSKTARTFTPLPPYPVTLEVRDPQGRRPKAVTAAGRTLRHTVREDGAVCVPLRLNRIWRVVRVDWAG